MKTMYCNLIINLEKAHRLFLDLIRIELDNMDVRDINNVQSIILYNIGNSQLTISELTNRSFYLGSNVSYNLRKMVQNGYLLQLPSPYDRRSFHIRLSHKGLELYEKLDKIIERQISICSKNKITKNDYNGTLKTISNLEKSWKSMMVHYNG